MFQVRFHGRGGQGVVTSAELLAIAAFTEGRYAQAFPSFGSERMGAPVMSFCRIDDKPIRTHEPVTGPDALIVQDATLLRQPDLIADLAPGGCLLVNSPHPVSGAIAIPASRLAMTHLGRPLPGVPLLGAFAAVTGAVSLDSLAATVTEKFSGTVADGNIAAAREAYDLAREMLSDAQAG
jgi:pyruvate ferredoxin oxidoreductase gamma subunit